MDMVFMWPPYKQRAWCDGLSYSQLVPAGARFLHHVAGVALV